MDDHSSEQPKSELVGQDLGDYHVVRRLGRGGMADVYLAEQRSLKRKVAVKVLRPELAADSSYVLRFQNEAQSVAALVHANIVQIYEVGCIAGFHFIAQEYVQGQNLKQLVVRNGPLSTAQAVSILRQVAAALQRAGQEHMIHRDIKPENILLTPTGEAKVADFGLARLMTAEQAEMTQAGITMGTPLYMSPEQVEGRPLDVRSDLYSCGATAFFMLVGEAPFHGDTPLSIAVQHLQNEPPSLHEIRPDVQSPLLDIIHRMLRKKPQDRFANATELLKELRSLKVVGMDDLPLEFEALSRSGELHSNDTQDSALDATAQLQTVLTTSSIPTLRQHPRWLMPAAVLGACLVGVAIAKLTWPGPLLAISTDQISKIAKKETAEKQWFHALFLNTEEAWQSVEKYFPAEDNLTNRYWSRRAQQQLALFYLNNDRLTEAYQVFSEFDKLEVAEVEFRAIGLAGRIMVHNLRGEQAEMVEQLAELWPDRQSLDQDTLAEIEALAEKLGIQQRLQNAEKSRPKPAPK